MLTVSAPIVAHHFPTQKDGDWPILQSQADLNDQTSLTKAVDGSHGMFAMTNFWEKANPATEVQRGKNVADACKKASIQLLMWSRLINVTKHMCAVSSL